MRVAQGTVAAIAILPPRCSAKIGSSGSGVAVCTSMSVATMMECLGTLNVVIGTDQVADAAECRSLHPPQRVSHGSCPAFSLSYVLSSPSARVDRRRQQAYQRDDRRSTASTMSQTGIVARRLNA